MTKLFLAWPNRVDSAVLSAGNWLAGLPRDNLLTRELTQVARSADATEASTRIDFDYGSVRAFRAFALVNHNLTRAATWRITLGSAPGASDIYDSGSLLAWRMSFDGDLLEWEESGWWEGVGDDEYLRAPYAVLHVSSAYYSARYMRVQITDTSNPDGWVQLGRVFCGGGLSPTWNASHSGWSERWTDDQSVIQRADGGGEFYDPRRRSRVTQFSLDWMEPGEAAFAHEMQRRLGTTGEALWVPDADDLAYSQQYGFLGRLRQLSAIEYPYHNTRRLAFEIGEIL
jgi:hypothetical protein